jgi:endoglucanase
MKMLRILLAALFLSAPLYEVAAATIDSLHAAAIRFYGYQRAGTKTGSPYNPFYTTSPYPHANDAYSGTALDGGWYDAGDFVKFGLPFGYAAYCLLKGYDAFPEGYDDRTKPDYSAGANTIPDVLDEVKVATDWMCKAIINASTIVRDVGEANNDHQSLSESGYQNSTRISNRAAYLCDGSDVPGYYAAALALMSILYKPHDAAYATACLDKAKIAYAFGKSKAKVCGAQIMTSENRAFYVSTTWQDKMACGGVELFRATGDSTYLREARTYISSVGQHYSNLGYPHAGDLAGFTFFRLGETTYASTWKQDVNYGAQRIIPSTSSAALVKGAFVNQTWGVASCAAAFGFSTGLLYRCTGDNSMRDIALQQLNWATGISPYTNSYLTRLSGGSSAGVQNPHHRNDVTLGAQTGIRLVGGLVSGPNTNASPFDPLKAGTYSWTFTDNSGSYTTTEVALDYNAGLVGLIAFKRWFDKSTCNRIDAGVSTTPLDRVDFVTTPSVSIKATLEKPLAWTLALKGRVSSANRQFTGTGASIAEAWDGTATTGVFQSGENVDISLTIADICDYSTEKSRGSILIVGMPEAPIPASAIKVDDFEDNNMTNALSGAGVWEGFSDRSDSLSGANSAKPAPALTTGKSGAGKGLNFRLTSSAGITTPYAGVKTWFNAQKTAVSIGPNTSSIIFDVSPTATGKEYRVEL